MTTIEYAICFACGRRVRNTATDWKWHFKMDCDSKSMRAATKHLEIMPGITYDEE